MVLKNQRNEENLMKNVLIRPPAVPLVTVDPYFSVWSCADNLYDDYTRHWTGKPNSLTGIILIDGKPWRFAGLTEIHKSVHPFYFSSREIQGMEQKSLEIKPLSSIYTFEASGVRLIVDFTTPLLLNNLDLMSRPISYISFKVYSIDEKDHDIKIYIDVNGEWCVNNPGESDQKVIWGQKQINDAGNDIKALYMGSFEQNILAKCGDDIRIDWGYLYLVLPGKNKRGYSGSYKMRKEFSKNGYIEEQYDNKQPRNVYDDMPVIASVINLSTKKDGSPAEDFIVIAYDDIYSIEYFHEKLPAYWKRNGLGFEEMLILSVKDYKDIKTKCCEFNETLISEGIISGGERYADLLSLAYRQAIAAHKLVVDTKSKVLFISKECFSNGCAATVDISYPSAPLFLLYNTELIKGMLRPVFRFASSDEWPFEFAPHDVGTYPKVNGQVYGLKKDRNNTGTNDLTKNRPVYELEWQMPVEECGNMLIMVTAISIIDKNVEFAIENWDLLSKWADYLVENGFDPQNQLCTDDFAGHLAHNTNLSIKSIMGIGGYSILCKMKGDDERANSYMETAIKMAKMWEVNASDGDHYKLTFKDDNTWSLKYNMVWDEIFALNLFSASVRTKEISYYFKKQNRYGTPLDCRNSFTKADWLVWVAAFASNNEDFMKIIEPIWDFLNESPSRVPFSDWYGTTDRLERSFQHRSVVGGVYIKLLKDTIKKHNGIGI